MTTVLHAAAGLLLAVLAAAGLTGCAAAGYRLIEAAAQPAADLRKRGTA